MSEHAPITDPAEAQRRLVSRELVRAVAEAARDEDLGQPPADPTSELLVRETERIEAVFTARAAGRLCGGAMLGDIAGVFDPAIEIEPHMADGGDLARGGRIATIRGPGRAVLAAERTCLNFLCHLSGIATLTGRYVAAVAGTKARICDTRKTIPGLRALAKYAVVCGGGCNHRQGLFDAVLIKDNHIAGLDADALRARLQAVVPAARNRRGVAFVEIEVDTLDQLGIILELPPEARPDIILLDNMAPDLLAQAVSLRDRLAPGRIELEASGGVNLETVAAIAATGIDRIAIGALTHSAPALDIGLDTIA